MPTGIAGGSLFTIGRTGRDATKLYALYLSFEHLRESLRLCFLCIGIIKIPDKPKRPADRSGVRICLAWSGLRDLNPRSLGPKPSAIPNFAKPGDIWLCCGGTVQHGDCSRVFRKMQHFFEKLCRICFPKNAAEFSRRGWRLVHLFYSTPAALIWASQSVRLPLICASQSARVRRV